MPSRDINDLHPDLQSLALRFLGACMAQGVNVFLTCTYRSNEEQDAAYTQGRSTAGRIITNARAGESPHNCTLQGKAAAKAFDFAIKGKNGALDWDAKDQAWQTAIKIGVALGLVSGANFSHGLVDNPHFELANWKVSTPPLVS